MEPRIQYAKTSDGVSIAFFTLGKGAPLVCMPQFPLCHIQREWQVDIQRHFYERLAQSRRLVLYDARGTGSSDRHVTALSLDAHILDLEAIVERLQLDQFALIGRGNSAPVAISVAARCPERVSRLVLVSPFARGVDRYGAPVSGALLALRDVDWTILTDTAVHLMLGWDIGQEGPRLGAFARECVSRDVFVATMGASDQFDVTALLAEVRAPTLVLSPLSPMPPIELVRDVASRIRDARLAVVERTPGVLLLEDLQAVARRAEAIDEFLGEGEPSAPAASPPEAGPFRTVLFTDLVGTPR